MLYLFVMDAPGKDLPSESTLNSLVWRTSPEAKKEPLLCIRHDVDNLAGMLITTSEDIDSSVDEYGLIQVYVIGYKSDVMEHLESSLEDSIPSELEDAVLDSLENSPLLAEAGPLLFDDEFPRVATVNNVWAHVRGAYGEDVNVCEKALRAQLKSGV